MVGVLDEGRKKSGKIEADPQNGVTDVHGPISWPIFLTFLYSSLSSDVLSLLFPILRLPLISADGE
jgi:hypothetical protein